MNFVIINVLILIVIDYLVFLNEVFDLLIVFYYIINYLFSFFIYLYMFKYFIYLFFFVFFSLLYYNKLLYI